MIKYIVFKADGYERKRGSCQEEDLAQQARFEGEQALPLTLEQEALGMRLRLIGEEIVAA